MNAPVHADATATAEERAALAAAIDAATDSIAPSWPLDRMIAVNPYWGHIGKPFAATAATIARLGGSPMTTSMADYRQAWTSGEIRRADLELALRETGTDTSAETLIAALDSHWPAPTPVPLLCDTLDQQRDLHSQPAWCDTITHQISQFCAAYFDCAQADWHPDREDRLYASWRSSLADDHSVAGLMRVPGFNHRAGQLAPTPEAQIHRALQQLGVALADWPDFLEAVLLRIGGWGAWCAYRRWQARLAGGEDQTLVDLLAIRLSWEVLLDDGKRDSDSLWSQWQSLWEQGMRRSAWQGLDLHLLWQRAREAAWQRELRQRLLHSPAPPLPSVPAVQAVFCIDVRSEVFRRHLEACSPAIQTLGFAGFFGLPVSYAPLGTDASRPQLPGLLAPALALSNSSGDPERDRAISQSRAGRLRGLLNWQTFQSTPLSSFTLVESMGLAYLGKLVRRSMPDTRPADSDDHLGLSQAERCALRPQLPGSLESRSQLAAQVLTAMSLGQPFARLVLLAGHGSQSRNNPQRAGLDCGACCGQTGEVNARALAALLNEAAVRSALAEQGIDLPETTRFVAGLHNTTTDEVQLFDTDLLPDSHREDLAALQAHLAAAGERTRRERAPGLGLAHLVEQPEKLQRKLRQRANDWAQTRPEWGLANNAAFIIAPRARTRGVDLQGRSFLHDYQSRRDSDGSILEAIMAGPMVVTHWINMQYYASTVDNRRYGSGNKTLHNVAGGGLGLFEGNGGDLRIGLALQSLHDGQRWLHTPLRLSVVIDAPAERIEQVVAKHPMLRQLVDNQWLYLLRFAGESLEIRRDGSWENFEHRADTPTGPVKAEEEMV